MNQEKWIPRTRRMHPENETEEIETYGPDAIRTRDPRRVRAMS